MIVPDPAKDLPNIITMGVLERRNLTYMPSELKVDYGAETLVTWVSEDGPFTLSFLPPVGEEGLVTETPFKDRKIESSFDEKKKLHLAHATVLKEAGRPTGKEPVRYHYTVTLQLGGHAPPLEDPECPPIVVLPLPG